MNRRNIRILSGVMALAIFASATNVFATTTAEYDEQISEIKAQQEANEAEAAELNTTLDALRAKTADAEEYQATLEKKIENYQQSIDLAREHIDELNGSIKELEGEIKKADAEYASTLEKLKKRLKALYTSGGELTTLEILLDSTSLHDFSMRSEAVKSFTRHDKLLMEEIKDYMLKTQEQRDALSAQKTELADQKKALESKQAELEELEAENQKLIEELNIQSANAEALIAQNERESQDYLAQLDQLIADRAEQAAREEEERRKAEEEAQKNQGSSGGSEYVPSGGGSVDSGDLSFGWPLAGYGYGSITQYYGGMYSGTPHKGLDIGVPYGTPIYASESGQVLSAEYHWSWGNNVLIWHNGTYSTRYAHCSSLAVSAGQYVEKGQVIGYVGSTGQSSGPHLHFEVYQNGTRVDPLGFV
ncbi:MAG: peptidoglycan DD-metalloendopeptidase family protein [Ruminococcus bromii]|nr:peptidoglycan DD-metalloendopeptidase family protein [Ruminococcus bromii]